MSKNMLTLLLIHRFELILWFIFNKLFGNVMKKTAVLLVFFAIMLVSCNENKPTNQNQSGKVELKNFDDSLSYVLGLQTGEQTKRDSINLNFEIFSRGFNDAKDSSKHVLHDSDLAIIYGKFQTILQEKQMAQMAQMEEQQKAKAAELAKLTANFLSENKKKTGVKETKSGMQYEIIKQGTGRSIKPDDIINMKFVASFPTGEVFDSTAKYTPIQFPASRVFPGWDEAALLMKVGGKYKFVFPPKLAFGDKGSGPIPPNAIIIFDVEVLDAQTMPQTPQGVQIQPQPQPQR